MKLKRIVILLAIAGLTIFMLICLPYVLNTLYLGGFLFPPPGIERMERVFARNKNLMITVTDYFSNADYDEIYVDRSDRKGSMHAGGSSLPFEDKKAANAVHKLLRKRYHNMIGKSGNTIWFQKWTHLDRQRGIAYSMDGSEPYNGIFTLLEPLSEPNWYYYEASFDEWQAVFFTNDIPNHTIGNWKPISARNRYSGVDYPLQDLLETDEKYGGTVSFCDDGTFFWNAGAEPGDMVSWAGTFCSEFMGRITLNYSDGSTEYADYLPPSQEIVLYTLDKDMTPLEVYFARRQ